MELKHSIQVTLTPTMISDLFFNSALENYNRLDVVNEHPLDSWRNDREVRYALTADAKEFIDLFCGDLDDVTPGELADDFLARL